MQKLIDWYFRALELLIVVAMVAMVFMVFGNVVLRYGFNSGIDISEEMSRYCFIWLTYIGAMVAMRDKAHVGVDIVIKALPRLGKQVCLFLSESLMLMINVLFFIGTWKMHELQVTNVSVVVGLSMIWIYGIGYVVSVVMALINLRVLYELFTGTLPDADLLQVEEAADAIEAQAELKSMKG
ncbi:MAG: TRAP transporter small permease [Hydrogenophaga sp.]|nr:TRAP transporter small permease [Hydrogenophaga sp.]